MLGKTIHKIRTAKGITLSELADRASMSKSYLSNIERSVNKNPSIHVLKKIASVLDVDLNTLLGINSKSTGSSESGWMDFVNELKELGIEKEQIQEYKAVLEFIKWKYEKDNKGDSEKNLV
jgi:XRE family transcriptional regulator of biofilm formation